MIKHEIVAASAAASVTGLLSNATGATWTLTATDCGDSLAHLITIKGDAATDHSAKTAIITGTGPDGQAQTETVNLPNGTATVTSTSYFLTVTTVVPSATISTDTMDIGWAAGSVTPTKQLTQAAIPLFSVGIGCKVVAGSPNYTVQHTYDGTTFFDHSTITGKTASFDGGYTSPVKGFRLKFTAAGSVTATALQVGG